MLKKLLLISLLIILALPIGSKAFQEISVGNNLLAEIKPTSPGPGELTIISLSGYGFDIDTSSISWFVNDQLRQRDIGNKVFSFNLGPIGQPTKVTVIVKSSGGQQASKTFIFDPAEIELFWDTNSSRPLFYQGKALPSAGVTVHFVAWPYLANRAGQKIEPAKLTYYWKKDDATLASLSGLGKNSITINTDQNTSRLKISVKVVSLTDNISATKNLVIGLTRPEIVFYEKRPLEGVNYGQIFPAEYSLFDDEVTVRAEPYFLPLDNSLLTKYFWTLDQSPAEGRPDDPLAITLRKNQGVSGSNRVSFSAQSQNSVFSNSFVVKYGIGLLKPQN